MDLISIIVPVYNVEEFIDVCLLSITKQTYSNLEIIIVDDGSTDNSGKICDQWEEKDNRIKVIHKQNGGLSDARNVGLDNAAGEWIMFVDSDDFVNLDMVRIASGIAKKNHSDLVAFDYLQVPEECNEVQPYLSGIYEELYQEDELLRAFIKTGKGSMIACNKLYRKELWNRVRFPLGKVHEDEYVIVDILEQIHYATVIDSKLYYYRQRQGSIMYTFNKKGEYDALEAFDLRCIKLSGDKELYLPTLNLYLAQLMKIYYMEDILKKRNIKRLFHKKLKNVFKYLHWKTKVLYIWFLISPKIYKKFTEMHGKIKYG